MDQWRRIVEEAKGPPRAVAPRRRRLVPCSDKLLQIIVVRTYEPFPAVFESLYEIRMHARTLTAFHGSPRCKYA